MCGLTGFWDRKAQTPGDDLEATALRMSQTLVHRGPDDGGTWVDPACGIAFAFRRLAIIDLSAAGHQPMVSANGRYVIMFNGEIYNYRELRAELGLPDSHFRGSSDTEVMLEAFSCWGLQRTLNRLIGMFAIALWDRQERTLHLMRDRLGIKPLYWALFGSTILFASELKALRAHPGWEPQLDRDALAAYMRLAYVPGPRSIYRGVHKLAPGTMLSVGVAGGERIETFWSFHNTASEARASRSEISDTDAAEELDRLLRDAVGRRMVADVPLGVFLSGGIDSSIVAALMQAQSSRPLRSFTMGFSEPGYNEAEYAKAVAAHIGTDHTELYVTSEDARDLVPSLCDYYDEPFADSSQIPTLLMSRLARRQVTVALSGEGGDEVFAGYNHYFRAAALWRRMSWLPAPVRSLIGGSLRTLPTHLWDRLLTAMPGTSRIPEVGHKLHKFAEMLEATSPDAVYRNLVSQWEEPSAVVIGGQEPQGLLFDAGLAREMPDFVERMRYIDTLVYLPDDILTKVDRASMAVGLEARVPLLDHRVVAFAWRLPEHMIIRDGVSKWLLRQVLYRYVPAALTERPKMGFTVPINTWLRGSLRDWAEDLLDARRLREDGILDMHAVRSRWTEFLAGRRNWHYSLWAALMFQQWKRRWLDGGNSVGAAHSPREFSASS